MYRGWTQTEHQNKCCKINQKDKGTEDNRGRDGETNIILRIEELETQLILHEHEHDDDEDDDDDDDDDDVAHMFIDSIMYVTFMGT
jgi:hypothetical protein